MVWIREECGGASLLIHHGAFCNGAVLPGSSVARHGPVRLKEITAREQ